MNKIPTNIIFGFLGAGKTTAILDLLVRKPAQERWAVLVNEFGEIGIDGKIIAQAGVGVTGVTVKEVPGGCLCCAAGVPFQVGLAELVRSARPDRLIIEPTGLGHPREIIRSVQSRTNQQFLALQNTITLLDPRKLQDERYLSHENFMGQIEVADILLANKADLCVDDDINRFWDFTQPYSKRHIGVTEQGKIGLEWLEEGDGSSVEQSQDQLSDNNSDNHSHTHNRSHSHQDTDNPNTHSCTFSADKVFCYERLIQWVASFTSDRCKAVVKTDRGDVMLNQSDADAVLVSEASGLNESIVEVIGVRGDLNQIGDALANCLLRPLCK